MVCSKFYGKQSAGIDDVNSNTNPRRRNQISIDFQLNHGWNFLTRRKVSEVACDTAYQDWKDC